MELCNFVGCSKALSKKDLQPLRRVTFDNKRYQFCEKHFNKITGMIVEMKSYRKRIDKSLKTKNSLCDDGLVLDTH